MVAARGDHPHAPRSQRHPSAHRILGQALGWRVVAGGGSWRVEGLHAIDRTFYYCSFVLIARASFLCYGDISCFMFVYLCLVRLLYFIEFIQ